ncbi:MAG: CHAT domain-containing protein, partial [Balneolaceae bacterium]
YFSKAETELNPGNNTRYYIKLLNEQAGTYEQQHLYSEALNKYEQVIKLTPKKNNPNHIDALVNESQIYIKLGNLTKVKELIDRFKSYDLSQLDFEQVVKAKTVESHYFSKIGKLNSALDILDAVLSQVVERAQSSADLKSGFWHVEDEYLDAFELAVSVNIEIGNPGKAVELLDQLKTINDASLYQNPLVKATLLNESELTQYKRLTAQLDATRKKLLTAPESQQFDIRQTISQLNLKKRKLDKKLTNHVDRKRISVRDIQNRLSAHDLVIHMTELKDKYYISNISRTGVNIHTVKLTPGIRKLFTNSIKEVSTHKTNLDSLYAITKLLGVKQIPDRINKVTIIPDSYFYQLPVDILPLDKPEHSYSYGEVHYVIEQFRTQYLTSLNDFQMSNSNRSNVKNQVGFAGYGISDFGEKKGHRLVPLPYARTEVTSIAHELTHLKNVETFINRASTKNTFTHTAPNAKIIHLATHSQVSDRDPMFSRIYLSDAADAAYSDSTFDNQIFAYELFELNLNNEMIMLNSCESGSGPYIQGTGVMGISRALQYAGANSLILNLWSVNDMMASDFAIHFYDQLNQGKSKTEALQNTKQYFLRNKNASPHYWGPYMLIGNSEPIIRPNRDRNLAMAGVFIGYFLLMISLSYLKDRGFIFNRKEKTAA